MKCQIKRPKIVMVPYPAQGHVTPMVQLASALVRRGFEPVVVTPEFIHRKIVPKVSNNNVPYNEHENEDEHISWLPVPDGLGLDDETPRDFFAIETAMENHMPIHLDRLLRKLLVEHEDGGGGIACVVVDLLASWAIEVANGCGVLIAGFWPVMFASYRLIASIPNLLHAGIISQTGSPQFKGPTCVLPDEPILSPEDLPWLIGTSTARASRFEFWIRTLDRSRTLRWLLVNSAPEDHYGKQEHCTSIFPVGPLISKNALTSSFWEEDMTCLDWLDKQPARSVVYVSFGSWVSPIGEGMIMNLALALEASRRPFVWVLGLSWRQGLPSGYFPKQGKVVSWAPQMDVLRHQAVGCYLTHCGWNSTMEAVQCMKPLVCYPVAGDQFVNCAYIVRVWQIGVRIRGFTEDDVEQGLSRVMEDSNIKQNLLGLNQRIMGKEATSRASTYLTNFIDDIVRDSNLSISSFKIMTDH